MDNRRFHYLDFIVSAASMNIARTAVRIAVGESDANCLSLWITRAEQELVGSRICGYSNLQERS